MRKEFVVLFCTLLASSCSGSTVPHSGFAPPVPSSQGNPTPAFARSPKVHITELNVPYYLFGSIALAVGPRGALYLGAAGSATYGGGSNLIRYFNGAFVQTKPYSFCFECRFRGVTAIDAIGYRSVVWASIYEYPGHSFPFTLLEFGGSGGTARPAPTSSHLDFEVGWIQSIVTSRSGKLWLGGTEEEPGTSPQGYPAQIPYFYYGSLILTNGPHDHVWGIMTADPVEDQNIIFEFAPSGAVLHSFPLPSGTAIGSGSGALGDVIVGNDHHLWVADAGHNAIDRMTGSGVLKKYAIPTANSGVNGVALAVDGSLWFTEGNANKVGRLGKHGHIVEFSLPITSTPAEIAANPEGGCKPNVVWVAQYTPTSVKVAEITY